MARFRFLLALAVVLASAVVSFDSATASAVVGSACDVKDKIYGFCTDSSLDGGEAVIRGDGGRDGDSRGGDKGDGGSDGNGGDGGGGGPVLPNNDFQCGSGSLCILESVSISDLASFRPMAPTLSMEPDGWMILGLPANFMVGTETHVVSGTLFDYPLDVRFTPSSYWWSWGDGSTSRSTVPGASWSTLGLPEFSPTPTSHVFTERGVYRISVTVSYTVEFRVDLLPWRSIAGTLPGPATVVGAIAGDAKTVLVEKECTRNPEGPGC